MFQKLKFPLVFIFLTLGILASFLIPAIKVNYNTINYLPEDSRTRIALSEMEKEFGNHGSLYIMVEEVDTEAVALLESKLEHEYLQEMTYKMNGNRVLFQLLFTHDDYSKESMEAIADLIAVLDAEEVDYYLDGQSYQTYIFNRMLTEQIIKIILFIIPLVLIILLVMTRSYLEPLLFIFTLGISVLINMGTNAFLTEISYMTYMIAPVIQFAVCMDYSIMLLHRYQDCRKEGLLPQKALTKAWKTSLVPIIASSITTIAGFAAIMFMKYRIGFDIGLVLAKGVAISLITVLFFLPVLILLFDKQLTKTDRRSLFSIIIAKFREKNQNRGLSAFLMKTRFILPVLALVLIIAGFIIQRNNDFLYSDTSTTKDMEEIAVSREKIDAAFGRTNQSVLLLAKDYQTTDLISRIENLTFEGKTYVLQILSYDKQYQKAELLPLLRNYQGVDLDLLYGLINSKQAKETVSLRELVQLLSLLQEIDVPRNGMQLIAYLNNFAEVELEELQLFYQLFDKTEISLLDILEELNRVYSLGELKELFLGMIPASQLDLLAASTGKTDFTIKEIISAFSEMFTSPRNSQSMALLLQDYMQADQVAAFYAFMNRETVSLQEFLEFFTGYFSEQELQAMFTFFEPEMITTIMAAMAANELLVGGKTYIRDFCVFLENYGSLSPEEEAMLLLLYAQVNMAESSLLKMRTLETTNQTITRFGDWDLSSLSELMSFDAEQINGYFLGEQYQRVIFTIDLPEESELSFTYFEKLEDLLADEINGEYHLLAGTAAIAEISALASTDYLLASILSIAMVFLIIMISFRSLTIPVILVVLIQGAVFINMAIPVFTKEPLVFIGYIIISCLQLGATIDYAILITHRYLENRKTRDRKASLFYALEESANSILNSGLILASAGFVLAMVSSIPVVASMGRLIGFGASVSMLLVILVLPQLLYLTDRYIIKKAKA
jgi:predicted RND superfamily exporter protein